MPHDPTRETLIQRVKTHIDQKSWEEFIHYYKPYLFRVVKNMVDGHHDCEDIVQKALLACWEKLPEYKYNPQKSRFRTWLCAIARNHTLKFFRDSGRYQNKMGNLHALENEPATPEVLKNEELEWKLYISNLAWENIKNDFEGKALDCFMMVSEGIPTDNIAQKLNISPGSVYVLKKRVTERLYREINRLDRDLT
jgi:RNA polymerase sigma factor (sigma-70 family)